MQTVYRVGDKVTVINESDLYFGLSGYITAISGLEVVVRAHTKDIVFHIDDLKVIDNFAGE